MSSNPQLAADKKWMGHCVTSPWILALRFSWEYQVLKVLWKPNWKFSLYVLIPPPINVVCNKIGKKI
jgi:hypothetical protein